MLRLTVLILALALGQGFRSPTGGPRVPARHRSLPVRASTPPESSSEAPPAADDAAAAAAPKEEPMVAVTGETMRAPKAGQYDLRAEYDSSGAGQ